MDQRRTMRWPLSAFIAVVALASVLVVTNGGVAEAKRLITGRDIAANTITGKNVKDHSLTAADFSGPLPSGTQGAPGSQGPKGDTGAKGDQGIQGQPGPGIPEKIYTWNVTFTADGSTGSCSGGGCSYPGPAVVTSSQTLPVDSYVRLVNASITGLSGCDAGGGQFNIRVGNSILGGVTDNWIDTNVNGAALTTDASEHLTIGVGCPDPTTLNAQQVPSFTANVTFAVMKAADMNATAFN